MEKKYYPLTTGTFKWARGKARLLVDKQCAGDN